MSLVTHYGLPGTYAGTVLDTGGAVFNAKAAPYGCAGNARTVSDGAMSSTSSQTTLACTTSTPFLSTDVGKTVIVAGAGAAGVALVTTISAFVDSGHVTLAAPASTTVSAAAVGYGANDTAGRDACLAAAILAGGTAYFPYGTYLCTTAMAPSGVCTIAGDGIAGTAFILPATDDGIKLNVGGGSVQYNFVLRDFALKYVQNQTSGKAALHIGNVGNPLIRNVAIGNSGGGQPYYGWLVENGNNALCDNIQIKNCQSDGIRFNPLSTADIVDFFFTDGCIISSNGGSGIYGLVNNAGKLEGIHLGRVTIYNNTGDGITLQNTSTGYIKNVRLDSTILDSNLNYGLHAPAPTTHYAIHDIYLNDVWCSYNSNPALSGSPVASQGVSFGQYVDNVQITGGEYLLSGKDGIVLGGTANRCVGAHVYNNGQSAGSGGLSTYYGINVSSTAVDYYVDGNTVYNDTYDRSDTYLQLGIYRDPSAGNGYIGQNYLGGLGSSVPDTSKSNTKVQVASAGALTLPGGARNNFYEITGTTTINTIDNGIFAPGDRVVLYFDSSVTVTHNASPSGTARQILLHAGGNASMTANKLLELEYTNNNSTGGAWIELAQT